MISPCPIARSPADRGSRRPPRRPCPGPGGRGGSRPRSRSPRRAGRSARRRAARAACVATARAIATRARSPCESRATRWVARSDSPTESSAASASGRVSSAAAQRERELDVLERGEVRHEAGLLADVRDLLAAQPRARRAVERGQLGAVDGHGAGGRQLEPGEDVQQRRLAGAGRAGDRVQAARVQLGADVLEDGGRAVAVGEARRRRAPRRPGGVSDTLRCLTPVRRRAVRPAARRRRCRLRTARSPSRRSPRAAAAPPAGAASRRGRRRSCPSRRRRATTPPRRGRRGCARCDRRCARTPGRG